MKLLSKLGLMAALGLAALNANAALYSFSYTFDASVRGTPGHVLAGVVEGTLQADGDTIVINELVSASLAGFAYPIGDNPGIRANDGNGPPVMSLSGDTLDFWICTQGFTQVNGNGGDCPFGNEGGFLVSDETDFGDPENINGVALAGIPEIEELNEQGNNRYRDFDTPINKANWSAAEVFVSRVSFSYMYEANQNGVPGHVLAGVAEGILLADGDTLQITAFKEANLDGAPYDIIARKIGIRAADPDGPAVLTVSGSALDFWVCVQGFTQETLGGGDCPFGAEGGFLVSDNVDFFGTGGGESFAGIPAFGDSFRDIDAPINRGNWSATVTKVFKPKKPKKPKKEK
jgi:hypothetical protein